jgi:hypothetical protein
LKKKWDNTFCQKPILGKIFREQFSNQKHIKYSLYIFTLGNKEKYKYKRNNTKQRDKTFFERDVRIF